MGKNLREDDACRSATPGRAQPLKNCHDWLASCLHCVVGRIEHHNHRYIVEYVNSPLELRNKLSGQLQLMHSFAKTGGLYIVPAGRLGQCATDVSAINVLDFLEQYVAEANLSVPKMADETRTKSITVPSQLRCPVVDRELLFCDLDLIPFMPHMSNEDDSSYNPSAAAPEICLNFSSDVFTFALHVRLSSFARLGLPPWHAPWEELSSIVDAQIRLWQRYATDTIVRIGRNTRRDLRLPVHVSEDGLYWMAGHEDSSFKSDVIDGMIYQHEMPLLYLQRLKEEWRKYFLEGSLPDYSTITRQGIAIALDARPTKLSSS